MQKIITKKFLRILFVFIFAILLTNIFLHPVLAQENQDVYDNPILDLSPESLKFINPAFGNIIRTQIQNNLLANFAVSVLSEAEIFNIAQPQWKNLQLPESQIKNEPIKIKKLIVTAYSSTPDQTDSTPFITASGSKVYFGTAAANCLPFETRIALPEIFGEQIFVIKDTMHPKFSCRIDIWFPNRKQAVEFGVKWTEVYIY